jgi:hypothetical protein
MKTPHPCQLVLVSAVLAFAPRLGASEPQVPAPDLAAVASGDGWTLVNRSAAVIDKDGAPAIRLVGDGGTGFARLENFTLAEGVIEFDARGKNVAQQSFLGVAFHGTDNTTYDAIYFRPFNFKAGDPMRRSRAVQYISHPNHTWDRLRNEHPGRYEQPVAPVPDPDAWFHVRVEVAAKKISVFVDGAADPCLVVEPLRDRGRGWIALWTDVSGGDFANLKITPALEAAQE